MARIDISIDDKKGVIALVSHARTVSEAIAAADLTGRTAYGIRLLHLAARQPSNRTSAPQPLGTEQVFLCVCGESFSDGWDAVAHCEHHHVSAEIRRDIDRTEDVIRALVVPDPLPSVDWDSLPTVTQEQIDAAQARNAK